MKILLTGANGYIGKRLLPVLVEDGHQVVCLVRDKNRLDLPEKLKSKVGIITGDLGNPDSLNIIPEDIEAAYFLVHSMSHTADHFEELEQQIARNFSTRISQTKAKQIIYLGGISNDENLSKHLRSRLKVERILKESGVNLTVLRAGIIIGEGSASFEIIRDLVEKLPLMIAPRWVNSRCQPIAIYDVINYMKKVLGNRQCYNRTFDIGGPDILTYKEMMLRFAEVRKLKRHIITVPVLTPRLSSYWLYFVTSISFSLAKSLVDSLKNEVVCKDDEIQKIIPVKTIHHADAVKRAFSKIEENAVISSWKDAWITGTIHSDYSEYVKIPQKGCFVDRREVQLDRDPNEILENVWSIGGNRGWYFLDSLWSIRGFVDKLIGGVGLRRGRTNQNSIKAGDALDFWRVLLADKENMRLLLYAEMKLPGEAWLEFKILPSQNGGILRQTATFRPNGLSGRLYWYLVYPVHVFMFRGMAQHITEYKTKCQNQPIEIQTSSETISSNLK
jgi:uncharacterized protein YbjT (DUF2867 family)